MLGLFKHMYMYINKHVCMPTCVFVYVFVCICMYVCVCVFIIKQIEFSFISLMKYKLAIHDMSVYLSTCYLCCINIISYNYEQNNIEIFKNIYFNLLISNDY